MNALTTTHLGFETIPGGWRKTVRGRALTFRRLRTRPDLEQTERLQRVVFGVTDRDLASFSILVVVHKTGGEVLGAFHGDELVGFVTGYGGYVNRAPCLVSDMMIVLPAWRGGLGYTLKTLQAAVALDAGFPTMRWTVDPLRAANARLNFARLGAYSHEYIEDLYGADFGEGLYGGMPSDRLVVTWPLTSTRVAERLLGASVAPTSEAVAALPEYTHPGPQHCRLAIPGDIDALLARDPAAALAHRFRLRAALEASFAADYAITGFSGAADAPAGYLLLTRSFVVDA